MKKILLLFGLMAVIAFAALVIVDEDAEESDADTTYTVTMATNNSSYGTVSPTTIRVSSGAAIDENAGDWNQIKIGNTMVTATPHVDTLGYTYRFVGWNGITSTVTSDMTITARFAATTVETCTVTIASSNTSYGTVSPSTVTVNKGWGMDETAGSTNQIKIGNTMVTATPHSDTSSYTYRFVGWNNITSNITSDMTVTANFARTAITYYTVSIVPNDSDYGSVSPTSVSVRSGTAITLSDQNPNVLTIGSNVITATPNPDSSDYTYSFVGWSGITSTVTSNMTITARFASESLCVVSIVPNNAEWGTVSPSTVSVRSGTAITLSDQNPNVLTIGSNVITATPNPDSSDYTYSFVGWSGITSTVTSNMTITARFASEELYTVTIVSNNSDYGTVSPSTLNVTSGTVIDDTAGTINQIKIGDIFVTATPHEDTAQYTYSLFGWNGITSTVTSDMTITAIFVRTAVSVPEVYWSNDNYNGRVDILFQFDSPSQTHTLTMDLYSPTTANHHTTWADTGKDLTIILNPNNHRVAAEVTGKDPATYNIGSWNTYVISIDTEHGFVSVTPVRIFTSFTDFTVNDKQTHTILDFSDVIKDVAVNVITHSDTGEQTNKARFSVVETWPFLDSYGVILQDPTINLHDYFPQYDSIRANFYSFALYGDSLTVNGITYPVTNGKVTVTYVSDHGDNYLPDVMPNQTPKDRTFTLTNMYVTYSDDGHAYITFADDRFTLDLGLYQPDQWVISMSGTWYFTSMAYEPYTAYEKTVSGWKAFPTLDSNTMVLIFLGIMGVAFAAVGIHVKRSGFGVVDLAIIGCAALIALMLLVV